MLSLLKKLFGVKPVEATPVIDAAVEAANSAPYKVPAPAETTPVPLVTEAAPAKKPASKKRYYAKKTPAASKPATKAPAKKPAPKKSKPAV